MRPAFVAPLSFWTQRGHSKGYPLRQGLAMSAQNGRTAVITGASGGIGAETAKHLSSSVPGLQQLILCARDTARAEIVASDIRRDGVNCTVLPVELASVDSTKECAAAIKHTLQGRPLDLLINNAGVMACPLRWTQDGIEEQYGVNYVAAALLTTELLPVLRDAEAGRVIFVSSMAVSIARNLKEPPLVRTKLRDAVDPSSYSRWKSYGESKLAMSMFAKALALRESWLTSVSLHPGVVQTDLGRHIVPSSLQSFLNASSIAKAVASRTASLFGMLTAEQGAQMSLEIAAAGKERLKNGAFYTKRGFQEAPTGAAPLLQYQDKCLALQDDLLSYLQR